MEKPDKTIVNNKREGFGKKFLEALEKEIPLIKLSRTNKYYLWVLIASLIVIIGFPILGVFVFTKLFEPLIDIFVKNFGVIAIGNFFGVLSVCLVFFGLIAISKIALSSISTVEQGWKAFFIYSITITVFLTGAVFIHAIVGAPETEWKLFNEGNHIADISCKDSNGKLIEKHFISCDIKDSQIDIQNITGISIITLHNGSQLINGKDFFAMEGIDHISLNLNATSNGEQIKLDTGFHPKFYTVEGEKERAKDFLTYFFGLLFVAIITIPQLVLKIINGMGDTRKK